jgi:hypothetical protein
LRVLYRPRVDLSTEPCLRCSWSQLLKYCPAAISNSRFGILVDNDTYMGGNLPYTIFFTYDVQEHALRFPLKAEVECASPGIYTITNIRPETQDEGSLLPPIRLKKENGIWIVLDNGQGSNLSATIGRALEVQFILA